MEQPIVEVKNLKVIYDQGKSNEVRSLDDISVKIYPHEYVIIFGPSGCGKSTLLYSMAGLQPATEGEIVVKGKKISQMNKAEMVDFHQTGVGMIFQAFYLIPSLSVLENVCLPKVFRGETKSQRREDGIKFLHRFSIVEQAEKFPGQLSGGQKQRVSIARSLINNPDIIFADEPVGNLDSVSAENVMRILKELNELDKKTIVLVTHSPEHLHFADRIIYIKDGKLLKEEVNKEKRPLEVLKKESTLPETKYEELTNELKLLMRTFKNLSIEQIGSLLVPFKADQLMSHVLSELNQEQTQTAKGYLKEFLFNNIDSLTLGKQLDADYEKGGAGWNKSRAESFVCRVRDIIRVAEFISKDGQETETASPLAEHLTRFFKVSLDEEEKKKFNFLLEERIKNNIDRMELQRSFDKSKILGGMGFHKNTAEKISREVEIIMLMKYSKY